MADNTYTNISDLPTLDNVGENTWSPVEVTGKVGKKVDLNTFAGKSDITGKADKATGAVAGNVAKLDGNGNLVDSGIASSNVVTKNGNPSNSFVYVNGDGELVYPSYASCGLYYDEHRDGIFVWIDDDTLTENYKVLSVTRPIPDTNSADTGDVLTVTDSGYDWVTPPAPPAPPTVGTLNTTATTAQTTSSSESLSGTVTLHKISKTGKYTDLDTTTLPKLDTRRRGSTYTPTIDTLSGTISLHPIAKTGDYADLFNKPALFAHIEGIGTQPDFVKLNDIEDSSGGLYFDKDAFNGEGAALICEWPTSQNGFVFQNLVRHGEYGDYNFNPWEHALESDPSKCEDLTDIEHITLLIRATLNPFDDDYEKFYNYYRVIRIIPGTYGGTKTLRIGYADSTPEYNESKNGYDAALATVDSIQWLTPLTTDTIDVAKAGFIRITGEFFEIIQPST